MIKRRLLIGVVSYLVLIVLIALRIFAQNPVQNPIFQPQFGAAQMITNCRLDLTGLQANLGATPLCTLPSFTSQYQFTCYVVITQAATTSSTMPACNISYTDSDSGIVVGPNAITATSTGNILGQTNSVTGNSPATGLANANVKSGTVVNFSTTGYVSTGATPMQYAIHVRTELVY